MKKDIVIILGFIVLSFALLWYSAYRTDETKRSKQGTATSQLIIGVNAEYPPFAFIKDKDIVGLDIDLIKAIAKILKKGPVFKNMSFTALLPEVQLGSVQVIASGVTKTEERAKRIAFSEPYLTGDTLVIVTKKDSPINSVEDLLDKTVVVNEGFLADAFISEIEGPSVTRLETINQAFMELNNNLADAFVSDREPLQGYFEKFGKEQFNVTPIEGTDVTFSFGISKKYPELEQEINNALNKLKQSDEYTKIIETWIPKETQ